MRQAFINTLIQLAEKDKRFFLLTGDLGFSVVEKFAQKFPERFINMGVAEANTIGVAAGLSLEGKITFVYSIIPFITMRCFEQIRNDLCQQNLNVKLIGVGEGLSYGSAGSTHHSLIDIAIMRTLPNMTVICPGDPIETEEAVKLAGKLRGPCYIRLGKNREPNIHSSPINDIVKGIIIENGKDITIISTGNMLYTAKQVADKLKKNNVGVRLISIPVVKPINENIILASYQETKAIFTLEEHSLIGGLGSAVAEILAENISKSKIIFKRFALPDSFCEEVGTQEYLKEKNSLSVQKIADYILQTVKNI